MIPYCIRNVKVQASERPVHAWYCFIMFIYLFFSIKACWRTIPPGLYFLKKCKKVRLLQSKRWTNECGSRLLHSTVNSNHHLKFSNCDQLLCKVCNHSKLQPETGDWCVFIHLAVHHAALFWNRDCTVHRTSYNFYVEFVNTRQRTSKKAHYSGINRPSSDRILISIDTTSITGK